MFILLSISIKKIILLGIDTAYYYIYIYKKTLFNPVLSRCEKESYEIFKS